MIKLNKGAMFGLDARIALAIFGALSVISGAALYSAIQQSKTVSYLTQLEEWSKASAAYYLDVSEPLPQYSSTRPYTMDLVVNRESLSTWEGPYINNITPMGDTGGHDKNSLWFTIFYFKISSWAVDSSCVAGNLDCAEWMHLYADNSTKAELLKPIALSLDDYVDGGDGADTGKIRYLESTGKYYLYYQGRQKTVN